MISFDVTKQDADVIHKIVARAVALAEVVGHVIDASTLEMDITAVHANGNPLNLDDLLIASEFDFAHDVFGIMRHIDRDTGELTDFFVPRFSKGQ